MPLMRIRNIGSKGVKVCSICEVEQPLDCFYKRKDSKDGYRNDCRSCNDLKSKKWRDSNPEKRKEIFKKGELKRLYGITLETFKIMSESQNHKCAICEGVNPDGSMLCVDHDHNTGAVRQLLCRNCNVALGNFRDNPHFCTRAAEYLTKHKEGLCL